MPYISPIKRKPFALWTVIFSGLVLPIPLLSIGGCGRETQGMPGGNGQPGALSIPATGFVRIVSRDIQEKPPTTAQTSAVTSAASESLHYKWSLIGERNWQNPKADKNGFTLGDVYALNSTTNRGGCNIWECDLTARRTSAADTKTPAEVEWQLIIHGSNGQTARAEGVAPLAPPQGSIKDVVQVVQTRDEPTALPTDVLLARIGTNEVRLHVAR